jgi:phage head maturation protease
MTASVGPRGWHAGLVEKRFADTKPSSYDKAGRTVDAVISMGSPVVRFYGTEVLRITPEAVNLDRMKGGSMIPLLDSHQAVGISNALGRIQKTWFARGALMGKLSFNDTAEGRKAEGMVSRGEIAGISAGYSVQQFECTDKKGNLVSADAVRWDDDDLTFTATRWSLHECSLVSTPADSLAGVRSFGSNLDRAAFIATSNSADDVLVRMQVRQRMLERQTAYDDRRAVTDTSDQHAWQRGRASSVFP